jgi:phosphate-selective porin
MFAGLLCAAPLARAVDASSTDERIRALETRLTAVERENAELRARLEAPSLGAAVPIYGLHGNGINPAVGSGVVVPAGSEARVSIGGFSQVQAEFGGTGDQRFLGGGDRIYVRRSRLSLIASFAEHFEARLEAEFGTNSTAATSGLRAHTNEVYLNWSRFPAANFRLGQLKAAFSSEILATEYKGPMVERSLGAERIGDGRQIGASVFGELIPHRLSYAFMLANGNGTNTSSNDNRKFHKTAHLTATAFDTKNAGRLMFGVGALHTCDAAASKPGFGLDAVAGGAIDNLFDGTRTGWGLDSTWRWGLLEISSELLRMRFKPLNRLPDPAFDAESWQLTAALYLVPQKFQVALRREHFDPNLSRRGDSTENWLAGLDFYFKGDDIRLMVDYLFGRAPGLPDARGRLLTRFQIVY